MSKQEKKTPKNTAYGIARGEPVKKNDGTLVPGPWQLVKIAYDLESGLIGDVKAEEIDDFGYGLEKIGIELENEALK